MLQCDQPQMTHAKQEIAEQLWSTDHIRYVPIDVNDTGWTAFACLLDKKSQAHALVMMEGVSLTHQE